MIVLALYVLTSSLGLVVLKLGTKSGFIVAFENNRAVFNFNLHTIAGLFFYGVSFFLYIYLLSKNDLGYIVPLAAGFVYILIFTASVFVFNEVFTIPKTIGIVLIIAGVIFLNLGK